MEEKSFTLCGSCEFMDRLNQYLLILFINNYNTPC